MVTVVEPHPHGEAVIQDVLVIDTAAEAGAVGGDLTAGVGGEGLEGVGQVVGAL